MDNRNVIKIYQYGEVYECNNIDKQCLFRSWLHGIPNICNCKTCIYDIYNKQEEKNNEKRN